MVSDPTNAVVWSRSASGALVARMVLAGVRDAGARTEKGTFSIRNATNTGLTTFFVTLCAGLSIMPPERRLS